MIVFNYEMFEIQNDGLVLEQEFYIYEIVFKILKQKTRCIYIDILAFLSSNLL